MAAIALVLRRRALRRERVFRDRTDPLEKYSDLELLERYRFDRQSIIYIHHLLEGNLLSATGRNHVLSVMLQVCVTLHFMATGSFLTVIGDVHGINKSTVSRTIIKVVNALCNCPELRIKFPMTMNEVVNVKNGFAQKGFPNTIGVIDGTHVRIKSPSYLLERNYVNRKLQHTINCQIICDSQYTILNFIAKWPGSTHDAFMWEQSQICQGFRDGILTDGWLLGDSGYPLQPWLLTPVTNPATAAERHYNTSFKQVRSIVERCIGILKSRFCSIDQSSGKLLFSPPKCCKVIIAAGILHNLAQKQRLPILEEQINLVVANELHFPADPIPPAFRTGHDVRAAFINDWFA